MNHLSALFTVLFLLICISSPAAASGNSARLYSAIKHNTIPEAEAALKAGANIEQKYYDGYHPLHLAVHYGYSEMIRFLAGKGADIEAKDNRGYSPLFVAVELNDTTTITTLLDLKADFESSCTDGLTPLQIAILNGSERAIACLLKKGANIESRGKYGNYTPLMTAVAIGNPWTVKLLVKHGADVNGFSPKNKDSVLSIAVSQRHTWLIKFLKEKGAKDITGKVKQFSQKNLPEIPNAWEDKLHPNIASNKMLWAARTGKISILKASLEKGANVEARDNHGLPALHNAIVYHQDHMVDVLLGLGARIDSVIKGATPLHKAAERNRIMAARTLLAKGAAVNCFDDNGETPLIKAAQNGFTYMVELLLDNGAKPDTTSKNSFGMNALEIAKYNRKRETIALIEDFLHKEPKEEKPQVQPVRSPKKSPAVRLLEAIKSHKPGEVKSALSEGASPDTRDVTDETALHIAVLTGNKFTVEVLMKSKANPELKNKESATPLHLAVATDNPAICEILLEHGANVDSATKDGYTPLHVAAHSDKLESALVLMKYKANTAVFDATGFTPLIRACYKGHFELANLLIHHGADINLPNNQDDKLTPIAAAVVSKDAKIQSLLIKNGADYSSIERSAFAPGVLPESSFSFEKVVYYIIGFLLLIPVILLKSFLKNVFRRWAEKKAALEAAQLHESGAAEHSLKGRTSSTPQPTRGISAEKEAAAKEGLDEELPKFEGETPDIFIDGSDQATTNQSETADDPDIDGEPEYYEEIFENEKREENLLKLSKDTWKVAISEEHLPSPEDDPDVSASDHMDTSTIHSMEKSDMRQAMADLATGADSQPDDNGDSALHKAVIAGAVPMIEALLTSGTNIELKNHENMTALHLAAMNNQVEIASMLLSKGADINAVGKNGFTPLMVAVSKKNKEMARLLLESGAKTNTYCDKGFTPLVGACLVGSGTIVKLLLSHGADVNLPCRDLSYLTPVAAAVSTRNLKLGKYLVKKGAIVPKQSG